MIHLPPLVHLPQFGRANSVWSPKQVPNLAAWYEGQYGAYDANVGGSLAADGVAVGRWEDRSNNAKHVIQATAANRPVYETNILNGKPVLRFTRANSHFLARAATDITHLLGSGENCTIFAVYNTTATNVENVLFGLVATGNFEYYNPFSDANFYFDAGAIPGARLSVAVPTGFAGTWRCDVLRRSGANMFLKSNGVTLTSRADASGTASGSGNFVIGAQTTVPASPFGGDLALLLAYNTGLSTITEVSLLTWVQNRYNLAHIVSATNISANVARVVFSQPVSLTGGAIGLDSEGQGAESGVQVDPYTIDFSWEGVATGGNAGDDLICPGTASGFTRTILAGSFIIA